jgi:hypothetical protein
MVSYRTSSRRSRTTGKRTHYPVGKLSYSQRQKLPSSVFAIPEERAYPIHNAAHARNALARVSAFGTPSEKRRVCAAVARRYPEIHARSCPMHRE